MVKRVKTNMQAVCLALVLAPSIVAAQDFDTGLRAVEAGDHATAFREWQPLAEQGNARAQFNLGGMYRTGKGVPQDYAEAVRWFRLAAEQGEARAQNNLALMYEIGQGVPEDFAEAVRWYRLAAEQGEARAQGNLGLMYEIGQGVPQDYVTAHMWFNIATANGEDRAELRDEIGIRMPENVIMEAQRRARVCMASGYKDCD